jgi:hypothetical protein
MPQHDESVKGKNIPVTGRGCPWGFNRTHKPVENYWKIDVIIICCSKQLTVQATVTRVQSHTQSYSRLRKHLKLPSRRHDSSYYRRLISTTNHMTHGQPVCLSLRKTSKQIPRTPTAFYLFFLYIYIYIYIYVLPSLPFTPALVSRNFWFDFWFKGQQF